MNERNTTGKSALGGLCIHFDLLEYYIHSRNSSNND